MEHRLRIDKIEEAMQVIDPAFLNTPQYVSESLSRVTGCRIIVKVEIANPIRCFKGRGAEYLASKLPDGARLVTASAGNLGQAMAYACQRRNQKLTVYASVRANPLKIERMRMFGAEVVLHGQDFDEAKIEAKTVAAREGIRMVEDSLDIETGEGAGTIGLELAKYTEPIDAVLVAFGNGALACGVGRYLKHVRPKTKIIAVQAAGAPAMIESWRERRIVSHESISTIADGIGIRIPIPECVKDMDGVIDEGILVDDASIINAMRLLHEHLGFVVEPSGAVGLAALLQNSERFSGTSVAVILCGGNVSAEQMRDWQL
jgi:threonine dehydratase